MPASQVCVRLREGERERVSEREIEGESKGEREGEVVCEKTE